MQTTQKFRTNFIISINFCLEYLQTFRQFLILKELRNCILRTILVCSLFYSIRVCTSLYFLTILLENYFFSSFCPFCVFCLFWIWSNLHIYIIIIYIVGVRYSVFLFSLITSQLNNLWEQISRHKNLIKNMPFAF